MPSWNHTLEDTDPFFNYTPFADGDYTAGWAPWFAGSGGFLAEAPGELGKGQSMHWTAAPGASVEVEFHGTAVYLYGSANCTYDVTIDDVASGASSTTDLLFSKNDLSLGRHFVSLTAHATPIGQFAFDKAIVSDDFPEGVDELVPIVVDSQNSTLEYSGDWNLISDSRIPSKAAPNPYRQTTDSAASVSLNFTGTAVAIHSPVNWGHWTYNVSLDGVQRSYNSSTYWLVGDTQLFWASGLDINKTHHIELTNTAGSGMFMTLNDITVYTKNGSSLLDSQSSTPLEGPTVNPAVLAGPIIAAMIGIMVILTGAYFLRRRRAREQLVNAVPEPYFGTSAPVETTFTAYAPDTDAAEKGQEMIVVVSPPAASALATHVYRNERTTVDSDAASVEERTWYNPHSPTSPQTFSQTGAQLSHSTSTQSHYTSTTESDQPHPAPHEVPPRYSH